MSRSREHARDFILRLSKGRIYGQSVALVVMATTTNLDAGCRKMPVEGMEWKK